MLVTKRWIFLILVSLSLYKQVVAQQPRPLTIALLNESADNVLTLVGTAPPNRVIAVAANRHKIRLVTADEDGEWSTTVTIVDEGFYELRAFLLDDEGTVIVTSPAITYTRGQVEAESEAVDFNPCPAYEQAGVYLLNDRYRIGICESLLQVSGRFDLELADVLAVNPQIENPSFIRVGQTINLPPLSPYTFEVTAIRSANEQHITLLLRYELNDDLVEEATVTYELPSTERVVLDSSLPRPVRNVDGVLTWRLEPFGTPRGVIVLELDVVDGAASQQFSAELTLNIRDQLAPLQIRQQSPLGGLTAVQATATAEVPTPTVTPQAISVTEISTVIATQTPQAIAAFPTQSVVLRIVPRSETVSFEAADDFGWAAPINLSQSGAAYNPVLLADNSDALHAFWNDPYVGMVYTRQHSEEVWTEPIPLPFALDTTETILQIDTTNMLHAVWIDSSRGLYYSRVPLETINDATTWRTLEQLATIADGVAFVQGSNDQFHLTYVGMVDAGNRSAAIQYRQLNDGQWQPPTFIFQSPYLRTLIGTTANTQVAADEEQIFVAWDATNLGRIELAGSTDFGDSWSVPITLDQYSENDSPNAQSPRGVRLVESADNVVAVWYAGHDTLNCALYYHQMSTDTLSTGRIPLSDDLIDCPDEIILTELGVGEVSLIAATENYTYLATWDSSAWTRLRLQPSLTSFTDQTRFRDVNLACFSATTAEDALYLIGCDNAEGRDVWLTRRSTQSGDVMLAPVDQITLSPEPTETLESVARVVSTATPFPVVDIPAIDSTQPTYWRNAVIVGLLILVGVGFFGYGIYNLVRD